MILGKICGKITTAHFQFLIEKEAKKFEFVQVLHKVYDYVLCQIVEIERTERDIAKCIVIGYKDEKGRIKSVDIPFDQDSEVLRAEDDFIKSIIKLEDAGKGAFIGRLEGKNIEVFLDLTKLLTKHVAILAKSGAGKSYTVGVLVEEIIEKKVPILIIDPHGEYCSLKSPNDSEKDSLKSYGLKPKAFKGIQEYGDTTLNQELRPLRLDNNLSQAEIIQLLPGKLSNSQMGLLYNAIKHIDKLNFTNVLFELEKEENNAKWTIINNLDYLKGLDIFSDSFVSYNEMIQPGKCTIINLKGIAPEVQEIIVYKLLKDLFEMRKKEKIPPFFTVIEEAHNYCPERSFGEARCSKIIRTVASEGRKFGLGLCVISQRPARVDKSVLSQCTTQIILKITNPGDIKAVSSSVEGLTAESEEEIKNLSIGTALITGIVDMPLFVNIRPRMTEHGGHATEILDEIKEEEFFEKVEGFAKKELLPIIKPKLSQKDLALMSEKKITSVSTVLVPGFLFFCVDKKMEYSLLVDSVSGAVVTDVDSFTTRLLPELESLSGNQVRLLHAAFSLKGFTEQDLVKQGMPLDIKQDLDFLIQQGYIEKGEKYALSEKYIFSQLSKHACFSKLEFLDMQYSHKLDPKLSIDKIKEKLSKFTSVKDHRECFIAKYEVNYD